MSVKLIKIKHLVSGRRELKIASGKPEVCPSCLQAETCELPIELSQYWIFKFQLHICVLKIVAP